MTFQWAAGVMARTGPAVVWHPDAPIVAGTTSAAAPTTVPSSSGTSGCHGGSTTDNDCEPSELLSRVELAFTAMNAPDWAEFIVRVRTPIAEDVDVYHYSKTVRIDGLVNELYRIRPDSPFESRVVELPATA